MAVAKNAGARRARKPTQSATKTKQVIKASGNWLAQLDRRARRLEPAHTWDGPRMFIFARYPHLQPTRWLDATGTSIVRPPRRPHMRSTDSGNLEPPSFRMDMIEVQAATLVPQGQERPSLASTMTQPPTGGLAPWAERYPDALNDGAAQVLRGKRIFEELILGWRSRIESEPTLARACSGLSDDLRDQLAAFAFDTCDDLESYAQRKGTLTRTKTLSTEADRRGRMLARKARHASKVLVDLRDYATTVDPQISASYRRIAAQCIEQLAPYFNGPSQSATYFRELHGGLIANSASHRTSREPVQDNMVRLYWFFVHACGVTGDEAEVRTGLIRNAFWQPLARPVTVRLEYDGCESLGCNAVHSAVLRAARTSSKVHLQKYLG